MSVSPLNAAFGGIGWFAVVPMRSIGVIVKVSVRI